MKYVANPIIVDAFKIVSVGSITENGNLSIVTEDGENRKADAPMLSRMNPKVGDYWVIQSDGYEYLNPGEVFDRKYRLQDMAGLIFYGPHPCSICAALICKVSAEQGGEAFDYPEGPIYPNTQFMKHACADARS